MSRKLIAVLTALLILLPIGIVSIASSHTSVNVIYERYYSSYQVEKGISALTGNVVIYTVESVTVNTTSNVGGTIHVKVNKTIYLLTFDKLAQIHGYVKIYASPKMGLSVTTNIPNLIRVLVNTSNVTTLVWAGLDSTTVKTYAYINGSATVYLQFANGTGIATIPVNVVVGHEYTLNLSLMLYTIESAKVKLSTQYKLVVQVNLPKRYQPQFFTTNISGEMFGVNVKNETPTVSYFNGSFVASLVWKGEGVGFANAGIFGASKVQFETIEFYGINGTTLGYVHMVSFNGSVGRLLTLSKANVYFGEEKIVIINGVITPHIEVKSHGMTYINGSPVIVLVGNNGEVSSTAKVYISHKVIVNGTLGTLVYLELNGITKVAVVTQNNVTVNVSVVKPIKVTPTIVSINGVSYKAEKVVVNSSGNIIFNVTLMISSKVVVYKNASGNIIKLNSENYFVINNTLIIFDDPVTTYYIVYNTTTTTTTQPITSTTPTTTTTTISYSTTQSQTASQVALVSPSSSSTKPITTPEIVIIAIIIIIIVGALLIFVRRK